MNILKKHEKGVRWSLALLILFFLFQNATTLDLAKQPINYLTAQARDLQEKIVKTPAGTMRRAYLELDKLAYVNAIAEKGLIANCNALRELEPTLQPGNYYLYGAANSTSEGRARPYLAYCQLNQDGTMATVPKQWVKWDEMYVHRLQHEAYSINHKMLSEDFSLDGKIQWYSRKVEVDNIISAMANVSDCNGLKTIEPTLQSGVYNIFKNNIAFTARCTVNGSVATTEILSIVSRSKPIPKEHAELAAAQLHAQLFGHAPSGINEIVSWYMYMDGTKSMSDLEYYIRSSSIYKTHLARSQTASLDY